jgi:hypothetical protein
MTDANRAAAPSSTSVGMSVKAATYLEYAIISLGLLALVLIFQPFSLALFSIGCVLVVAAGLINNLLPLCEPGVSPRIFLMITLVVAMVFLIVLLVSISAAHLYGVYFVEQAAVSTTPAGTPYYAQPFIWTVAAAAVVLAGLIKLLKRRPQA